MFSNNNFAIGKHAYKTLHLITFVIMSILYLILASFSNKTEKKG